MKSQNCQTIYELLRPARAAGVITVAGLKGSIMNIIDESEQLFSHGRTAMLEGDFKQAVSSYNKAIQLFERIGANPPAGVSQLAVRTNMANAYCDLAACILETCGSNVNSAVHALLSAIEHGNTENGVLQNILYSMSVVNAVMEARVAEAPSCVRQDELIRWHNQGYDLLKTPYPPGRSERNWEGATRSFEEALRIAPDCAASYHGLGLAYEGAKKEIEAINAWRKVKELEPNYNFQQRVRFEFVGFSPLELVQ